MRTNIRPSVPADAPAIVALLAAAGLKPNVEPEALDWKYWQEREDWAGARSYVATRGAQILAHAAVVPGSCAMDSRRVTVLHLIDWASRADATGVGVSLMKHLGRLADALLAVAGSGQTLRILPHIGLPTVRDGRGICSRAPSAAFPRRIRRSSVETPCETRAPQPVAFVVACRRAGRLEHTAHRIG